MPYSHYHDWSFHTHHRRPKGGNHYRAVRRRQRPCRIAAITLLGLTAVAGAVWLGAWLNTQGLISGEWTDAELPLSIFTIEENETQSPEVESPKTTPTVLPPSTATVVSFTSVQNVRPTSTRTPTPNSTNAPSRTPTSTPTATLTPEPIPSVVISEPEIGADDYFVLLDGVGEIGAPGVPGSLCVYGSRAFPVIVGATWIGDGQAPVMAASRWKEGRIVALGHDGYFTRPTLETADTGRMMTNALTWASGELQRSPRIGVADAPELHAWLKRHGHDVGEVSLTLNSLATVDVVATIMWNQGSSEHEALSDFVRGGGGLVTASTGWGWAQLHPRLDIRTTPATGCSLTSAYSGLWAIWNAHLPLAML